MMYVLSPGFHPYAPVADDTYRFRITTGAPMIKIGIKKLEDLLFNMLDSNPEKRMSIAEFKNSSVLTKFHSIYDIEHRKIESPFICRYKSHKDFKNIGLSEMSCAMMSKANFFTGKSYFQEFEKEENYISATDHYKEIEKIRQEHALQLERVIENSNAKLMRKMFEIETLIKTRATQKFEASLETLQPVKLTTDFDSEITDFSIKFSEFVAISGSPKIDKHSLSNTTKQISTQSTFEPSSDPLELNDEEHIQSLRFQPRHL